MFVGSSFQNVFFDAHLASLAKVVLDNCSTVIQKNYRRHMVIKKGNKLGNPIKFLSNSGLVYSWENVANPSSEVAHAACPKHLAAPWPPACQPAPPLPNFYSPAWERAPPQTSSGRITQLKSPAEEIAWPPCQWPAEARQLTRSCALSYIPLPSHC